VQENENEGKRTAGVGNGDAGPGAGLRVGDLVLQVHDIVASGNDVNLVVTVDVRDKHAPEK
jgi:hypothetical protein